MENNMNGSVRIHTDMTLDWISIWHDAVWPYGSSEMHHRTDARGRKTLLLHRLNTSIYGAQTDKDFGK